MDFVLKGIELYVKVMFVLVASVSLVFLLPGVILSKMEE